MNGRETHGYRVICKHGKVRAMSVDDTLTTGHCLKDLRDFRKWAQEEGATIDRVTIDECRKSDMHCPECDASRKGREVAA